MRVWLRSAALLLALTGLTGILQDQTLAQESGRSLGKVHDDTDRNTTSAGNIALTVSNFGTIGTRNAYWPNQPSCEYPRGSRVEHMYQGALWVGGVSRRTGQIHVTTGSSDRISTSTGKGMEFVSLPGSPVTQRSTLSESQFFDPNAVSHQDFLADYSDLTVRDSSAPDQTIPLGLRVHQESYAWNFPFADFFVILQYTIYNTGRDTVDSVYVGLWTNNVVRNTNSVRPGTPGYFSHGGNGYLDTLRMLYTFDYDGIPAPPAADSYIGVKLLGTSPFPRAVDSLGSLSSHTYYNAWRFNTSIGDADYFSPQDDAAYLNGARSRYDRLASSLPPDKIPPLRTQADNMTTLLSTGGQGELPEPHARRAEEGWQSLGAQRRRTVGHFLRNEAHLAPERRHLDAERRRRQAHPDQVDAQPHDPEACPHRTRPPPPGRRPHVARARVVGTDHAFKQERDEQALRALAPDLTPPMVAALSNCAANGGTLIVGVSDDGTPVGIGVAVATTTDRAATEGMAGRKVAIGNGFMTRGAVVVGNGVSVGVELGDGKAGDSGV